MRKTIGSFVFKAAELKDHKEKVAYLHDNLRTPEAQRLMKMWLDPEIHFLLPEGPIPTENNGGELSSERMYGVTNALLATTNVGALRFDKVKREDVFLHCCEGLMPDDLKLLELIKDKKFPEGLDEATMLEAFPKLNLMAF